MTDLDLDKMLGAISEGQWSVDAFDWQAPSPTLAALGADERRSIAQCLLFVAGLERLGSEAFRVTASQETDPRAKAIFQLVSLDEERHAEAEVRMAVRLGHAFSGLPRVVRWFFRLARRDLAMATLATRRLIHENISMQIVLFELGLDSFFTPMLKERLSDPLHDEIVRRIERDESRHLAMDYWLLDRRGREGGFVRVTPVGLVLRVFRLRTVLASALALLAMRKVLATLIATSRIPKYRRRVAAIRTKAPMGKRVPALRYTLDLLARIDRRAA